MRTKSGARLSDPGLVASSKWQFLHHASARRCPLEMLSWSAGAPEALCSRISSNAASAMNSAMMVRTHTVRDMKATVRLVLGQLAQGVDGRRVRTIIPVVPGRRAVGEVSVTLRLVAA